MRWSSSKRRATQRLSAAGFNAPHPARQQPLDGLRRLAVPLGAVIPRYAPWAKRLQDIASADRMRRLRPIEPTGPATARVDGREVVVANSNDYLGLAWHPNVRAASRGGGVGGSRLISGDRPVHHRLEARLEAWMGRPVLLFPSGYQANLAVLSTVLGRGDRVASDALNHASLIDGMRLSRAHKAIVPHLQPQAIPADVRLIVVEGLFSMDGDRPDLRAYPTTPWLLVDEAHAIGCLGPEGRGVAASQGITPDIVVGTFGKALGCAGAFVVGPPELKQLLINAGRGFIFTTGTPEPLSHMALAALDVLEREGEALRERLALNAARLRQGLRQQGWSPLGDAHIVPVVLGPSAMACAARALDSGVLLTGIRYPTVPAGEERIRLTVSAAHTDEAIDRIVDALGTKARD